MNCRQLVTLTSVKMKNDLNNIPERAVDIKHMSHSAQKPE